MGRLVWCIIFIMVALSGCGDGDAAEDQLVTDGDSGSEIEVATGERFEVRLESNATTGYQWQVDPTGAPSMIELVSSDFIAPADQDVVGAPGVEVFVYEATGPGAGILRLEYLRPFDDPPIPDRIVEFIVRVDGAPWPPDPADIEPPSTATATVP